MSEQQPDVARLFLEFLRRTHLSEAADLAQIVDEEARHLGASGAETFLADYEQLVLVPVDGRRRASPLSVAGTVAGRAYRTTTILDSEGDRGGRLLWVPLIDGTDRLGVLALAFGRLPDRDGLALCERYAHLVAITLLAKSAYSDVFEHVRRRRPMSIASELLWELTPPLVAATDRMILGCVVEPSYDHGGDALDYAIDSGVVHLGVFDAMGHGLAAAGAASFAISAYRHSRRRRRDLLQTYAEMDDAVGRQFPGDAHVTALIAELDLPTGELAWITAGHPPPLRIRAGHSAELTPAVRATPLGVSLGPAPEVTREALEPEDLLLLYTDGITEARTGHDSRLGVRGLAEFVEHEAASGAFAPEILRRLRHAIVENAHEQRLDDDATAMLLQWSSEKSIRLLPEHAR